MVSMRSIWKGSVAFGLVNVPVKVYAATEEKDVRFHQVHARGRRPDPVQAGLRDSTARSSSTPTSPRPTRATTAGR